jgi:hypothetical protein
LFFLKPFRNGALMHPGETRTELTMGQHYTWKGMRKTVQEKGMRKTVQDVCKKCGSCQLNKPKLQKLGHLPEKEPETIPWDRVCINLIGSVQNRLHCLVMIDRATGWFEIAEIPAKTVGVVMNIFEQEWLTRYPYPIEVVMDRGTEFIKDRGKVKR